MHFISGLPRSGSTLLASILSQNPDFTASIMTPLGRVVTEALTAMGPSNEAEGFFTDEQRESILRGIIKGYYSGKKPGTVVFDNNRRWCANMSLIDRLYPDAKVIACVRAPAAIVDSFERLFQKHPLSLSVIYGSTANLTVYERTMEMMKPTGVIGYALNALRTACYGPFGNKLLLVNYDNLAQFPMRTMNDIHNALSLPLFPYDFDNIKPVPGAAEFDRDVSTPGLHDLRPTVSYEPRQTLLPPDIWKNLPPPFWLKEPVTPA